MAGVWLAAGASNFLVAAAAVLLLLWLLRLLWRTCGLLQLAVAHRNGTVLLLEAHSAREVEEGLVPRAGLERHLRAAQEHLHPPKVLTCATTPLLVRAASLALLHAPAQGQAAPDEAEGPGPLEGVRLVVDSSVAATATLYWGVARQELLGLTAAAPAPPDARRRRTAAEAKPAHAWPWRPRACAGRSGVASLAPAASASLELRAPALAAWEGLDRLAGEEGQEGQEGAAQEVPLLLALSSDEAAAPVDLLLLLALRRRAGGGLAAHVDKQLLLRDGCGAAELQDVYGMGEGDEEECVVCLTEDRDTTLLPCHHFVVCFDCYGRLDKCPMCRSRITAYLRFRSEADAPAPGDDDAAAALEAAV